MPVGSGCASTWSRNCCDRGQPLVDGVAEEAAVGLVDAVLRRRPRSAVSKPRGLLEASSRGLERQVDRAVEHQPADLVGEQLGVRRAELGAVGRAEVGQRRLAERGAQHVHVAGGLDGRDVRGQVAGARDAAGAERASTEPA